MGQHLLHVHRPAGVLLLLVPAHMLACNQIRCKNMRTYCDQTFFKCKPSLNMLSLCGACDAPTSPCACIASAASSCGHCKQQSHTKMIPAPIEGKGGGGAKPTFRMPFFIAWKPWDDDPSNHLKHLKWNINMTFFNKPLALQVELAGSM